MARIGKRRPPDFAAEGLLKGLRGKKRAARLELLEYLWRQGVSLDELREAVAEDRLAILPAERVLAEEPRYTLDQLARRSKLDGEVLVAQRQAAGLPIPPPDEKAFSKADLEAAHRLKQGLEAGLPREALLEGARIFGRLALQAASTSRSLAADAFLQAGDTERDAGLRLADVARALTPQTVETLQYLYQAHLRELLRNDVIASADLASGRIAGTREVAVCFADLVGFTRLGQELPSEDLGALADRLGALAHDVARSPVSLVKTVGDAVLLASPDPAPLLDSALRLLESAGEEDEGFPRLRAGVAMGEALNRWGDWYGAPVNVASRVTAIARPASVLATQAVHDATADAFTWTDAGRHQLKGISGEVTLYRCRRSGPPAVTATKRR
jgi:adenylate cyclase